MPRASVGLITLGKVPAAAPVRPPAALARPPHSYSPAATNSAADLAEALRKSGANTNLIQQVQKQFLSDAGPEANDKFNELLSGYMTGKLSVNDIRTQAKSAADPLRELNRTG